MMQWTFLSIVMLMVLIASGVGIHVWRLGRPKRKGDPHLHQTDDDGFAPLPLDPNNPPTWRYYRPKRSNPNARRTCHCHNREIKMDDKVLWWPLPDGSVRLLCKDAKMKAAQQ